MASAFNGLRTFDGGVAVITGAASGIGRAFAQALGKRGAILVLGDLQSDEVEKLAADIRADGGKASARTLDVTDWSSVNAFVQDAFHDHGRIDYMFNNAGIGVGGEAIYYELDDWMRVLAVNLNGVIHGVQAAYGILCKQGFGHIVNTASMAGLIPSPNVISYTTSKHAVVGLSNSLRIEAEPHGVRVSVLCPGVIRTPIIEGGKYGKTVGPIPKEAMGQLFERLKPLDVDIFADLALRDIAKNKAIIIHPARWRWIWRMQRLWPGFGFLSGRKSLSILRNMQSGENN